MMTQFWKAFICLLSGKLRPTSAIFCKEEEKEGGRFTCPLIWKIDLKPRHLL
jgi:hypothetical protein